MSLYTKVLFGDAIKNENSKQLTTPVTSFFKIQYSGKNLTLKINYKINPGVRGSTLGPCQTVSIKNYTNPTYLHTPNYSGSSVCFQLLSSQGPTRGDCRQLSQSSLKKFHSKLSSHRTPLVSNQYSVSIPFNPPRRLERRRCRDLLDRIR